MTHLRLFSPKDIVTFLNKRAGETKVAETIGVPESPDLGEALSRSAARFVILGLPEDIGVRANGGIGGAHTAWNGFLKSFLNIQDNEALKGQDFLLLGEIDFTDWMVHCDHAGMEQLRSYTSRIDDLVYPVIQSIVAHGKIPLVVGGGHNNAYPIIKGCSRALDTAVNAINLDAHSDFRVMEGRHSGNGFRYAYEEGLLKKYALLGLHEAYNSKPVITELRENPDLCPLFWEEIFLRREKDWAHAIAETTGFVAEAPFGVELDVDCIENALSSAATPVGITVHHALQYLYHCGSLAQSIYLHLPEGVTERADGQHDIFTGKRLSYLLQAFVKGVSERS